MMDTLWIRKNQSQSRGGVFFYDDGEDVAAFAARLAREIVRAGEDHRWPEAVRTCSAISGGIDALCDAVLAIASDDAYTFSYSDAANVCDLIRTSS